MIERRHEHGTARRGELGRDLLAILALPVVEHDLGAEPADPMLLDLGCVRRHHDDCLDAEPTRR